MKRWQEEVPKAYSEPCQTSKMGLRYLTEF